MSDLLYEAETMVLGALLKFPQYMDELTLEPDDMFADEKHPLILKYIKYTYNKDGIVDIIKIIERSGKNLHKIGHGSYLMKLQDSVPTAPLFDYYQSIVKRASIDRKKNELLERYIQNDSDSVEENLNEIQAEIESLQNSLHQTRGTGLTLLTSKLDNHVSDLFERSKKTGVTGVPHISKKFVKMSGGYQRQDLVIVGARPSMGKTQFILNESRAAYKAGFTPAIFSIETKTEKMAERLICQISRIESQIIRSGQLDDNDWFRYSMAREEFDQYPIYIDDTSSVTIQYIRQEVKKLVKSKPNTIVFIDYLQLISGGDNFKDKRLEMEYISRSLKQLARDCDIPIVALSQLSRKVEERQDKRPMLSDLKEAGGIEADADIVIFLYRDEYYNRSSEHKGIMELIIAKGREIGTGTIKVAYEAQYGTITDLLPKEDVEGNDVSKNGKK